MKSLQVLTPSRPCIFNCPFCISKTHNHHNDFINNYEQNYEYWESNFIKVLKNNGDLKTVVITGTNEPLQDEGCVKKISKITKHLRPDIKLELQTRYYGVIDAYKDIDIVGYSISDYYLLDKIDIIENETRYVIILTDTFNDKTLKDILKLIPKSIKQLTLKKLHDSKGVNKELDNWVRKHKTNEKTTNRLKEDINNYFGDISIFFDEHCMEADDRYMIFREDGNLYRNFETKTSEYIEEK